ncbi:DNA translocase FtsK [Halomonas sp. M20]|uniref:DNA translocase FtsK n=1 Tax=Halomonas sp. M20 TaxID=2763264 RepID=UPI001D0B4D26|nr:DNA translocase FtsK 4TM domain-containing protein [Halomonas sp. M20]
MSRRQSTTQAKEKARRFGLRLQGSTREGVVIVLLAACVFLLLALFSYTPQDPGWSQSGPEQNVVNWMGRIGAWLSDVLYSLFGVSALWWPGMLGFAAWRLMRRREVRLEWDATALAVRAGGFVLLLLATTSLGALHFYSPNSELPYSAGGILGEGLRDALVPLVGLRGATLLSIASFLCGFPLFSGLSWLTVMDELGMRAQRLLRWLRSQFGGAREQLVRTREAQQERREARQEENRRGGGSQLSGAGDESSFDPDEALPWWKRWLPWGQDKESRPHLDHWQTEPALAGGQRLEPRFNADQQTQQRGSSFDEPGMPLRAERDTSTTIPWEVPAQTPSAKQPGAAYTAQEASIQSAFSAAPTQQDANSSSPSASVNDNELRIPASLRRPVPAEPSELSTSGSTAPASATPSSTSTLQTPISDQPAQETPHHHAQEQRAFASSASSSHSMARQEPPDINWNEWNEKEEEDDAPHLTWSDATAGATRETALEDSQVKGDMSVREDIRTHEETHEGKSPGPQIATAEQAQAAAADPQGPTLWTVEHLQSQRPSLGNLSDEPDGDLPPTRLLTPPDPAKPNYSPQQLADMAELLETRLREYGVKAEVVETWPGPVITRFEIKPAAGVKVSKISNLAKDLARSLMVKSVRVVEVIPGRPTVGIEIPNPNRAMIRLSEVTDSDAFQQPSSALTLALGHDIGGGPVVANLGKMPHLLVAGTTGSGKSVGVNAMLISMLLKATPAEVRMIMVDPKMLELSVYDGIPHLLAPVVTDMKEAANSLRWCVAEMERRYKLMAAMGVRNIAGFNAKLNEAEQAGAQVADPLWEPQPWQMHEQPPVLEKLPYIVVVIDEFADMFMIVGKKVEELIARLAQKARAAGIHLILATQRPSVDVVTGLIKANVPTRMAFQVSSKVDSRTILDQGGAEALLGHGDMLYLPAGSGMPTRVHGAFVDDDEVHRIVEDWKRRGEPEYIEEILTGGVNADALAGLEAEGGDGDDAEQDALYDEAVMFVTETRRASISAVQRRFKIGYNRAARLVESMESAGVVSSMGSNGSREVLAPPPVGD